MQKLLSHGNDTWMPLIGRILLSLIFILSGFAKMTAFGGSVGYAATVFGEALATPAIIVAILVELLGGLMLLVGFKTRLVAWILAVYTLVAALAFHNFWAYSEDLQQNQMIHFMKNLAIVGGMLFVGAFGAGKLSVDHKKHFGSDSLPPEHHEDQSVETA